MKHPPKFLILIPLLIAGCQQTSPTTQPIAPPSLSQLTTTEAAVLKGAEDGVTMGIQLHGISGATYWAKLDPLFTAGNQALSQMKAAAAANDSTGWQAAEIALLANVALMQPFITAAAHPAPTTGN